MNSLVNPLAYVAYILLTVGIVDQIRTTYDRKEVKDISFKEVLARFVAQLLIMWKMITTTDSTLIIGHAIMTAFYMVYFVLLIRYKYFSPPS